MGKYVEIREPMISADKVYSRWPGIHGHEYELAKLIDLSSDLFAPDDTPIAYSVQKILEDGTGGIIVECTTFDPCSEEKYYPPYRTYHQGSNLTYDFSDIAFKLSEIVKYENNNPKLLFNVITNIDKTWNPSEYTDEYLRIEDIRKFLQLSPYQFISFLNDDSNPNRLITSWEEGFTARLMNGGYGGGHVPFFAIEDLSNEDLRVHSLDWKDFQQREKKNITPQSKENISSTNGDIDTISVESKLIETQKELKSLRDQLSEAQILIAELKDSPSKEIDFSNECSQDSPEYIIAVASMGDAELAKDLIAEKDARIAVMEAKLADLGAPDTESKAIRTRAATQARQETVLENWQAAFKIMVPVILQCHTEGAKKRTNPDIKAMLPKENGDRPTGTKKKNVLTDTQIKFLKECLKDILGGEHVNTDGGPSVQG